MTYLSGPQLPALDHALHRRVAHAELGSGLFQGQFTAGLCSPGEWLGISWMVRKFPTRRRAQVWPFAVLMPSRLS